MARIQLAAPIADIAGSIGGITFQRNSSGLIARRRSTGKKAKTLKQSESLQKIGTQQRAWQQLSEAQQIVWNDYAALYPKSNLFGQSKNLTGLNWFISINQNLDLVGSSQVSVPPARVQPPASAPYSVTATDSALEITFAAPFSPANSALIIRATSPVSITSNSLQKQLRLILVDSAAPFTTIDLQTVWQNYFGVSYPPGGPGGCYKIFVSVQTAELSSGLVSVGLFESAKNPPPTGGIGVMIIGSTFIVA